MLVDILPLTPADPHATACGSAHGAHADPDQLAATAVAFTEGVQVTLLDGHFVCFAAP
ncbi:hypothetical protein [Streptomyces sp. NPDC085596]|uniref:hypothetical protein n=1 Tax=Streptomyces sp. NPDC085596 TaxID=3365731 RepID=UPI0037D2637D